MATTTNYGWETPDDTDLVKDGAAAIRTLGSSIDTTTKNLNPETTLGDISYRSSTSNTNTRLAIGTTGQVLTVSGGVPAWATPSGASGPAFFAYRGTSNQTLTANTETKVQFNAEKFDTDNCFDSTTNYRFTPNKAGYYEANITLWLSNSNTGPENYAYIFKNGSLYAWLWFMTGSTAVLSGSTLVYLNGTTDYIEGYVNCARSSGSTSPVVNTYESGSNFSAVWVRS